MSASRAAPPRAVQVNDLIADRYELEELVGSGGMSTVFRARDRLLDRRVALKVLHDQYTADEESVERFRREAWAVAQLSHPSVVTVIDRGEADGRQFIVFEYVAGENLKELVGRTGPLPVRRALELAIECADALAFAHANGLVHRDVKPQNVLVDADGRARVTDFGIARSLDVDASVTQTGTVIGTSTYLSPEQARGRTVTPASDVYSLAIVIWELLTGEPPFGGENFVTVALRHINEQPPSLSAVRPDVPPRLAAAVDAALAKEPENRLASMTAFAQQLRLCLDDLDRPDLGADPGGYPMPVPPATVPLRQRRPGPRPPRAVLVALGALAVAAAIAAAVAGLRGKPGSPATTPSTSSVAPAGPVALRGVGNVDPGKRRDTHAATAPKATDGDPKTFWYTQTYTRRDFGGLKPGLGLVLDAGHPVTPSRLRVTTGTPGFTAEIRAGDARSGPFTAVSGAQTVSRSTSFELNGASARYWVVWITRLPAGGKAEIAEVTAGS